MSSAVPGPEAPPVEYQRNLVRPTLPRRLKWRLEEGAYLLIQAVLGALNWTASNVELTV